MSIRGSKKHRHSFRSVKFVACAVAPALAGMTASVAEGAGTTYYWIKGYGTNWNINANWSTVAPGGAGASSYPNGVDVLADMSQQTLSNNNPVALNGATTLGALYLGDPGGQFYYSIGKSNDTSDPANVLTFQTSSGTATLSKLHTSTAGKDQIYAAIVLNSNLAISNVGTTVANALALGSNVPNNYGGLISGAGSITVNSGYVIYGSGGANIFSGGTTINSGGVVEVYKSAGIGTGSLVLNSGKILFDNSSSNASTYTSNPMTVTGTSELDANGTGGGNINMGSLSIGGTLNVVKTGSSDQYVSFNAVTLTGNSTINGSNGATHSFHLAQTVTVAGTVANNTTTTLTMTGTNGLGLYIDGVMSDYSPTRKLGLTVNSTNATTLGAANTYTGNTLITGGTLTLSSAGSINNSAQIDLAGGMLDTSAKSSFAIANGQTLLGQGTFNASAATTIGGASSGTLIVGQSQGVNSGGAQTLTANVGAGGTFTLASNSTSEFDLWNGAGSSDQLAVTGTGNTLTYGGTLQVANPSGFTFANGQSWDLFNFTNLAPATTFSNNAVFGTSGDGTNLPKLNNGLVWNFDYSSGVLSITAIPEPAGWGLLIVGATGALTLRRRRRSTVGNI